MSISSAFVLIAAPFIGCFVATAAVRAAAPRTLFLGRSACLSCGHRLGLADLVPLVSWFASRGRCRHCRGPISFLYPGAELAAVAVALLSITMLQGSNVLISCALGWTLLMLALIDLRHQLLPDPLTLPLAIAGLALAGLASGPVLLDRALGCAAGFVFFYLISDIYLRVRGREGLGLGDAKLLAAGGAWVAWQGLPSVVLVASTAALAVVGVQALSGAGFRTTARIPLGLYLAPAIWLVWLIGPLAVS